MKWRGESWRTAALRL
ncbi:hypothetical protein E2C01_101501 [Portunus trituberculatus]|uniref:Uncharacterized protein n=1 Tax=Portunus trituberculatus TaxID=210409 RepID=A0A5B7K9S4_PORTR|nr:hypothetical protein [Portunus trituberculatus]